MAPPCTQPYKRVRIIKHTVECEVQTYFVKCCHTICKRRSTLSTCVRVSCRETFDVRAHNMVLRSLLSKAHNSPFVCMHLEG